MVSLQDSFYCIKVLQVGTQCSAPNVVLPVTMSQRKLQSLHPVAVTMVTCTSHVAQTFTSECQVACDMININSKFISQGYMYMYYVDSLNEIVKH